MTPRGEVEVRLVRLASCQDLPLPDYATAGSAGADLHAALGEPLRLLPGDRALVPTGLRMALPAGFEAQVRPRSGRALRDGITLLNSPGTVDSDYRGELKVLVVNLGREPVEIRRGERVAQLVIAPVSRARFTLHEELPASRRGEGGFGHTGGMGED